MTERRIQPLAESVVNKIAAGEIVQRPSNAVKELLDNCVDAGATSISLLVKEGGLKLLQVQDNGCGIHVDDMPILCQRHTTSKLATFDELAALETLGFRGEALASMSYVSLLTVTTKRKADAHAWRAAYEDGRIRQGDPSPCAGVDGTTVTVEDLFFNVPMRKRAIKNASDEFNCLLDVVQRYAVYHAGVSMSLRRVGTTRVDVHTQHGLCRKDAIRHVYGTDVSNNLEAFEWVSDDEETAGKIRLEGFLTGPGYTSARKAKLVLFVNGRCVDSAVLRRCVESVYAVLLPKGTKPFVFLSITMPQEWVDVNVHPTKMEVAMLHEWVVCDCLRQTVEKALLQNEESRTIRVQTTLVPTQSDAGAVTRPAVPEPAVAEQEVEVPRVEVTTEDEFRVEPIRGSQVAPAAVTGSKPTKQRPEKLVRVDAQSQTLHQLLAAPSRKNRRSGVTLDLGVSAQNVHEGVREILKEHVVVGWVDAERILVQKATKLYLLDIGELSYDLFVQLATSSGVSERQRLTLRPPASVAELLSIALSSQTPADTDEHAKMDCELADEVASLLCELLEKHAAWLEAEFGIVVSAGGERLVQIPELGPVDGSRLPPFVLQLAADVEWTDDGARRSGVTEALAELFRLHEGDDEARSNAVWEEVRASLIPERRRATDGSVVELTRLEQLYRTFERC